MRYVRSSGSRSAVVIISAAVTWGSAYGSVAIAQGAAGLPPLDVTAKAKSKKKTAKAPPAQAPAPTPSAEPAPAQAPTVVSGEPPIGTNTTDISSQDLERIHPSDLQDVFKGVPGISVSSSLPISQKVYVNGIEETNLVVTIDGGRQNNKIFHHSGTTYIDPDLLKAVQVYAGVAPADAGPGALGGSIAYETKDVADLLAPGRNFGGSIAGDYETNGNVFTTSVTAYARSSGFEALGFAKYGDGGLRKDGNGDDILGSETSLVSGLGKLAYQGPSGDRVEVSYESVRDDAIRPFRSDFRGFQGQTVTRPYDLHRQNAVFTYTDETPTKFWDPTIKLAYSVTDLEVNDDGLKPYGRFTGQYHNDGQTGSLNGKVENRFAFGANSVVAGVDFYNDDARLNTRCLFITYGCTSDPTYPESFVVSEDILNVGAYSQVRLEGETGRLSFGGRYDSQWFEGWDGTKLTTSGFSGNVSGEFDLTSWLMPSAGYSRVWSGIPLAEPFVLNPWPAPDGWDYSNGIQDVTANNAFAGLKFHYNGFSLLGRVFETEIHNARTRHNGQTDVRTRGYDLTGEYNWKTGFVRLAFANIDAELDGEPADSSLGYYLTAPVGKIITAQIVHSFAGTGVTVGADAQIALEHTDVYQGWVALGDPPSGPIPSFEVVNAFVEYKPIQFSNLTLRMDAKNIFDEAYASRTTYGQEYSYAGGVVPLLEPGRSFVFSGKITY